MSESRAHARLLRLANHIDASAPGVGAVAEGKGELVATPTSGDEKKSRKGGEGKGEKSSGDAMTAAMSGDMRNGGDLAARAFVEQKITHIFTLTGGHIAPILVGANKAGIKVVDVRDEATTVFAADAMARLTGIPGVAIVTAGPGLTNTITAVKNAQLAQSPVIVCAGATAIILKGRGSLQDIDQFALMKPHVKKMFSIQAVRDIIPAIREAFVVAQEGVPGPVFIEFPIETLWPRALTEMQIGAGSKPPPLEFNAKSLMVHAARLYIQRHVNNVFKDAFTPVAPLGSSITLPQQPLSSQIELVAKALTRAERPVILIGSQALRAGTTDGLRAALESLGVPVFLSGMGRGLLGRAHPLQQRHKRGAALAKADFVLLAGVPADFRLDYGRHINIRAFFATVNLCRVTLNKNNDARRPNVKVLGDSVAFIRRLSEVIGLSTNKRREWRAYLENNEVKREREIDDMAAKDTRKEYDDDSKNFIGPIRLCRELDAAIGEDSVIVADGGDFVGTASYIVKPRGPLTWLDPGVFGTLGVGGGFALAAKCARPKSEVWILYGDGASGWGLTEFDSYVRHGLPVIAVIGNDACWSQMYRDQIRLLKDPVATELAFTHYETVAEGFGAKGILVRKESEIRGALARAKEYARAGHPVIVNCLIGRSAFREGSISL